MNARSDCFGLTLMVNHACNLRCHYCYTGAKFSSPMRREIGVAAIDRAFASLKPGGQLNVGFFGGEPLLEANQILDWMTYARDSARHHRHSVRFNVTTNGTLTDADAWTLMTSDDLDLAVSFDGDPETHDRHRVDARGHGSAAIIQATLQRLVAAHKAVHVNFVVRPDTLDRIGNGLVYLRQLGIRHVDLSLDLWTTWTADRKSTR